MSDRPVDDLIVAHLTARIPNETEEERLYGIVVENQMHWKKHSMTCQQKVKIRGRFTTTQCRFGFPRPMLRRTFVFENKNRRYSIPGVTRRTYFIARRASKVNNYNAAILLFWKANIDLQYVPADATDIVNYITSYTTKGEKAKKDRERQHGQVRNGRNVHIQSFVPNWIGHLQQEGNWSS
ncbi:hypothetical protein B9Z55_011034 [Caenorhabditis nigoni]|nr:hypothetical protein B9Z55_011034 [Caenorhabditis nigoni]